MDIPSVAMGAIGRRKEREHRPFGFIGSPKSKSMTESEHKRWHGMPPTRIERERLSWRAMDIKF
jgi:hypothetical protein